MNTGINWGDLATWVTGFITLGLLIVALIQIRNEREARNKREKELEIRKEREQAEHISCWMVRHGQYYVRQDDRRVEIEWVAVLNQSTQPVYQVIINIVRISHDDRGQLQEGTESRVRSCVSVVPPGLGYIELPSPSYGMSHRFGVEIGFKDSAGRSWVRKADGDLLEIEKPPVEYYNVILPTGWQIPQTEIPPDDVLDIKN